MRQGKKKIKSICEIVEELLLKENIEALNQEEIQLMNEHLKECNHCTQIAQTLKNIQQAMATPAESLPTPDNHTRQHLLHRMASAHTADKATRTNRLNRIKPILEYRIPLYQVVLALFLTLFIFFATKRIAQQKHPNAPIFTETTLQKSPTPGQLNIVDDFRIISEQKIGVNAREDSLLTRLIVSLM
ncbi:MAG: hypothetical protein ACE5GL_03540 [Calditrichia bacterium]